MAGGRRSLGTDLPPEAEHIRAEARAFLDSIADLPAGEQRLRMVDEGYLTPSWPRPWGRDAGALELLVIEEEFRDHEDRAAEHHGRHVGAAEPHRPTAPTAQRDRWILPTLRGEIIWCQLFSEPGAGSDLASLATHATCAPTADGC